MIDFIGGINSNREEIDKYKKSLVEFFSCPGKDFCCINELNKIFSDIHNTAEEKVDYHQSESIIEFTDILVKSLIRAAGGKIIDTPFFTLCVYDDQVYQMIERDDEYYIHHINDVETVSNFTMKFLLELGRCRTPPELNEEGI